MKYNYIYVIKKQITTDPENNRVSLKKKGYNIKINLKLYLKQLLSDN